MQDSIQCSWLFARGKSHVFIQKSYTKHSLIYIYFYMYIYIYQDIIPFVFFSFTEHIELSNYCIDRDPIYSIIEVNWSNIPQPVNSKQHKTSLEKQYSLYIWNNVFLILLPNDNDTPKGFLSLKPTQSKQPSALTTYRSTRLLKLSNLSKKGSISAIHLEVLDNKSTVISVKNFLVCTWNA